MGTLYMVRSKPIIRRMSSAAARETSNLIRKVVSGLTYYNERARREEIRKYSAAKLMQMVGEEPDSVLVALVESRIVAFCISRYDDGVVWLAWFAVHEDFRGRNIGPMLLNRLEKTIHRRNCHKIWCDTRTSNKTSQRVLRKAGYTRVCKIECHWYGQDFYLWQKHGS
jgi:ribosomal protein S18 acetylase RimI-like enzyme